MSIEIKYFENRKDWRKWLNDNFEIANEVWFVFPSKSSGEKSITYNDAVEEALCFEWIDSTIKSLDKEHKIQHFTPRNPKSTYSQANSPHYFLNPLAYYGMTTLTTCNIFE